MNLWFQVTVFIKIIVGMEIERLEGIDIAQVNAVVIDILAALSVAEIAGAIGDERREYLETQIVQTPIVNGPQIDAVDGAPPGI